MAGAADPNSELAPYECARSDRRVVGKTAIFSSGEPPGSPELCFAYNPRAPGLHQPAVEAEMVEILAGPDKGRVGRPRVVVGVDGPRYSPRWRKSPTPCHRSALPRRSAGTRRDAAPASVARRHCRAVRIVTNVGGIRRPHVEFANAIEAAIAEAIDIYTQRLQRQQQRHALRKLAMNQSAR